MSFRAKREIFQHEADFSSLSLVEMTNPLGENEVFTVPGYFGLQHGLK